MTPPIDKLLFMAASSFPDAIERRAFLEFACHGDEPRLRRIEELLEIRGDAEDFFEMQPEVEALRDSPPGGEPEAVVGARIGPYRLIERIGSGGWGVVYLAEQREPVKRKVALKIIRLGMDTESVISRFNVEREALALMDHPNIARVLDAGATASGRPYFVMELVDGEKITEFCDRKRLDLRGRLELFILVCGAIQHAHQKGVIHRDIKPSNILVREDEGRIVPKVIDFGIAKATAGTLDVNETETIIGQIIGTPAYMSPEQAERGVDVDTRSDIYSLGAVLCELLTGSPPLAMEHFTERGVEDIRRFLKEGETGVPSQRLLENYQEKIGEIAARRGVDPQRLPSLLARDLDWIVMKAMEKERARRYDTADGFAMDVRRYLQDQAVLARPPSRRYLLAKLVRRNRVTFAAASVALFGLLGGLGLSTWLLLRERDARNEQARMRGLAERAMVNEIRLREEAKASDLVTQAMVFVKYNEMERADQLLELVTVAKAPRSFEAAAVFDRVAGWNLEHEHFQTAARRFHVLGHVLTSVDMTDSEQVSFNFMPAITAVSEWGLPGQYEELRDLALIRFGNSANPVVAEHIVKATLLEPADRATLERVKPLISVLEDSLEDQISGHMIAWRQFSLGLMAYRQGRFGEAADWARQSMAMASNSEPRTVSNQLILLMIEFRQGREAEAREGIAALSKVVRSWSDGPFMVVNPDKTLWYNQGAVRVLLREAEEMAVFPKH